MANPQQILARVANLTKVFREHPEYFNFKKLNIDERLQLLEADYELFSEAVDISCLSVDDRARIIVSHSNNSKVISSLPLEKEELKKIRDSRLVAKLIYKDKKKYLSPETYDLLLKSEQQELFLKFPTLVKEVIGRIPKLNAATLLYLSESNPAFVDENVTDFSKISTYDEFWNNMFKFNKKYRRIFIENMNTLVNKTELRNVIRRNPTLIKDLNGDNIAKSKLTIKEWILLIRWILEYDRKGIFDDWKFSDELIEIFRLDLMAEMLMGKSKTSSHLQSAMARVFGQKETE